MKIRIKTKFWQENNPETWKTRYEKVCFAFGIFFLTNVVFSMIHNSIIMLLINIIATTITATITISYNKRTKNTQEVNP